MGRLQSAFTGTSARAHVGIVSTWGSDGPYAAHDNVYDVWGNTLSRTGWGGINPQYGAAYTNNKMNGMVYDAAGNLRDAGGGWTFTYDATGQQATSAVGNVQMFYDGDRLRGKKNENGTVTYYLRSSVLGGQVVAEINQSGNWSRGYVYLGGQILAVQQSGVYWMHQDPAAKSKRVTDASGNVMSTIELDPWGGETNRSSNEAFQPRKFTTYERDSIGSDEAMHRRYNRWWARFEQPDPYSGSYNLGDPQSLNRYSYVQNDPVNFVDPTGLDPQDPGEPPPPPMPPGPLDVITTDIWGSLPGGISASGLLGGDSHAQLLVVNFISFQGNAQEAPARSDWNSCAEFVDYLVDLATAAVISNVKTSRISGPELAASKLGIRMAGESYLNYHQFIDNQFEGFRDVLIQGGQHAGVYAHVLGNAGLYLHGGITGNVARGGNSLIDFVQSFYKGQEGEAETAGNAAGKQVGQHMWNYLKGSRKEEDATNLRNNLTTTLCQ